MIKSVYLNPSPQLVGEARVNQPVKAELTLLNPLPEPLKDCSFTIGLEGLTDSKPLTLKYVNSCSDITGDRNELKYDRSMSLIIPGLMHVIPILY